jgi:SAM-dependent methyltransferase
MSSRTASGSTAETRPEYVTSQLEVRQGPPPFYSGAVMSSRLKRIFHLIAGRYVHRIMRGKGVVSNAYLSAKLMPLEREKTPGGQGLVVVRRPEKSNSGGGSVPPAPPRELQEGWGPDYLVSGDRDMKSMLQILEESAGDLASFRRVLDFGCSAGRMLRFFPEPEQRECWGVDIKAAHIAWCQEHLSPPFLFATTTTLPHLPFEDDYFDLVYCGSVFTHIGDLPDSTFLELRRVLRPGGFAHITICDEHTIESLHTRYPERPFTENLRRLDAETGVLSEDYAFFSVGVDPWTLVFYDSSYLIEKWSRLMEFRSLSPEAMDYQTALVFRKRPHVEASRHDG